MNDAVDKRYVGHDEEIIEARELAKTRKSSSNPHSKTGFFCPLCREPVQFIYSEKIAPYFKHLRDSPIARECDRFFSTSSSSEVMRGAVAKRFEGNQLFIHQMGESFGFYIGLAPLSKEDINFSSDLKVRVVNQDRNQMASFRLSDKVRATETTYLQMRAISGVYIMSYTGNSEYVSSHWKEKTFGIQEDGAIFTIGSTYCKKIPINGNVYCGTEYYLICPDDKEPEKLEFLKVKDSWKLEVIAPGNKQWRVYKVVFTENSQEAWDFALDLQVTLLEKESTIIPFWPPAVHSKNKRIFSTGHNQALFLMGVPISECKCCTYDFKGNPQYIKLDNISSSQTLITTQLSKSSLFLSPEGNKKKDDVELSTSVVFLQNNYVLPEIKLKYGDNDIPEKITEIYWVKNRPINFTSNVKCTLEILHKSGLKTVYSDTIKEYIPMGFFSIDDKLIIWHGNDKIRELIFIKKVSTSQQTLMTEEYILEKIKEFDVFKTQIATPAIMRYLLPRMKTHPNVSRYIRTCIITGRITHKTCEFIIETYSGASD